MTIEWTPKVRRQIVVDGIFSKLMDTFTGGVFLAGLGLFAGANNFVLGLLASMPFLAQVAQLPTVALLMRAVDRRRIVVIAIGLSRTLLWVIAGYLLLAPARLDAPLLVALVGSMGVLSVVATGAWNWWMRDVVPRAELGRFFGRRMQVTTLFGAVALVIAGATVDWFESRGDANLGYAAVFAAGGLAGYVGVYFLSRTPHPRPAPPDVPQRAVGQLWDTLRTPAMRPLLLALTLTASTLTIALPFTAVYLLRGANYTFFALTVLSLVSQLAYMASLRGWGHLSDRFGNRPVLQISVGLLVAALLGWSFTGGMRAWPLFAFLLILHFVTGYAVGGIDLTGSNILLKTAPEHGAPAYLAAVSLCRATMAGIATILAGAAWQGMGTQVLAAVPIVGDVAWEARGFHVLAIASAGLGFLAILALRRVHEEGGHRAHEVARAMRREVHMISSVAGIRAFVHVVSYMVEFLNRREQAPPPEPPLQQGSSELPE